jgi:hypothetical protein
MKPIREMNDKEFEQYIGVPREFAISMMLLHKISSLPPRVTLPNTKLSGVRFKGEGQLLNEWFEQQKDNKINKSKVFSSLQSNLVSGEIIC